MADDTTRQDAWLQYIDALPSDPRQAIDAIHRWVKDAIRYEEEPGNYWQAPQETLARGRGDCEDFAILWFASLRIHGLWPEDVRLSHINTGAGAHMICEANIDGTWWALDNMLSRPVKFHRPPVYQTNEQGTWVGGELHATIIEQWERVQARMAELDSSLTADLSGA